PVEPPRGRDVSRVPLAHAAARNQLPRWPHALVLPYDDAAITTILLEHARLAFTETHREFGAEVLEGAVEARIGAPTHLARSVEHFLRAHLGNQVRMRAHEHAAACDVA